MSRKETTPVSVRVARWAAIAAAITAFSSVFTTMWSERPWWSEPPAIVQPVSAPGEPVRTMAMAPSQKPTFHVSKWLLIGAIGVGLTAAGVEVLHHRRQLKRAGF